MRYTKLIASLCVLVVIAFATLCFRVVFSVSDINVEYSYYKQSEVEKANEILNGYKRSNLLFIKEDEIINLIHSNTDLKVESVEKKYPNVLNVKLKERQEMFAIKVGDEFLILDDEYTVVDIRNNCVNDVDNLDNILLEFKNSEFNGEVLNLRSTLTIGNNSLLSAFKTAVENIESPRDYISKIIVEEKQAGENYYFYFNTLEGVTVEIRKATELTEKKVCLAMEKYLSLDDGDKLLGKVASYKLDSGEVVAIYTK